MDDQKYFAYLDERKKVEERNFLSGAARYNHILVDEFQDDNPLDLALVKATADRNRVTVIIAGDDDQAIFEWCGVTPEYILDTAKYFGSPFDTYILGGNYRSPGNVVEHSQRLIAHNENRIPKQIEAADNKWKARIEVKRMLNLDDALEYVHKYSRNP